MHNPFDQLTVCMLFDSKSTRPFIWSKIGILSYSSVSNRSPGHSYYFSTFFSQEVLIKDRTAIVFSSISDNKWRKHENIEKMVKLHAKYNVKKLKIVEILLPGSLFKGGCLLDF